MRRRCRAQPGYRRDRVTAEVNAMSVRNLLVICGGRSAEHEVALQSALNVVAAVERRSYALGIVGIDRSGTWWQLPPDAFAVNREDPARTALAAGGRPVTLCCRAGRGWLMPVGGGEPWPVDVAFPVLHGTYGEDGTVQGLLAMMNIPCVGCDQTSSANCMDKAITKQILRYAGIPVADGIIVTRGTAALSPEQVGRELGWPVFVKPARQGSSVGVSKVKSAADLAAALAAAFRYDDKVPECCGAARLSVPKGNARAGLGARRSCAPARILLLRGEVLG